jgi:hypothetical protein
MVDRLNAGVGPKRQPDNCSEAGAKRLAARIAENSVKAGYPLRVRIEPMIVDHCLLYVVRSTLALP